MTTLPDTQYARSGEYNVAYQVVGDGPLDLVWVPGFISNVELTWQNPVTTRFFERLASFSRLIIFDKRGTGLSDRVPPERLPTLEERMDDVRAVMDASGSERAVIAGLSEGGQMAMLFASTYPQRTESLVLVGSFARVVQAPDYIDGARILPEPFQPGDPGQERCWDGWGTGSILSHWMPTLDGIEQVRKQLAQWERQSCSPGGVSALAEIVYRMDVRPILPTIRVPTLVVHARDDAFVNVQAGRYLAENIPGARYVEIPAPDHVPWIPDPDAVPNAIEEFVTGRTPRKPVDRVLATVMFTDIVSSTEQAVGRGDRGWTELLDRHDAIVRRVVESYGGKVVKTTGDGALATFDGPARGIHAATTIRDEVGGLGLRIRAGLHTGEVELRGEDVGGVAVHIGSRVSALAAPDEVLVSGTVKDLVFGSGIEFADRGPHELKGVPGAWPIWQVLG